MQFTFTVEQQMLLDTARRFVSKEYDFATRQKFLDAPLVVPTETIATTPISGVWQGFAELGLLALNVPESEGGLDGTPIDTLQVMTAMGEALVLEPYLASAVMATNLLTATANPVQRAELLPALASGDMIAVVAHDEASSRFDWRAISTRALTSEGGYLLNGKKSLVSHADAAHLLLVSARLPDQSMALFGVPRHTIGVELLSYRCVDGVPTSEVTLTDVALPAEALLDATRAVEPALASMRDLGLAAVCAEAVGILDRLLAATVDYTRQRQQFGGPIARFQALQHRMAEMVLQIEQARSMSYLAAVRCSDPDLARRAAALSAAKVVVGQACRLVGQGAVQLHGGMGVSDELIVSHYFKRLMAIELQFGSTDEHLEAFATQLTAQAI